MMPVPPLVTLFTSPDYYGAEVDEEGVLDLPVTSVPVDCIDLFEPVEKLTTSVARANIRGMLNRLDELPPIVVRSMPNGRFEVLDGHHRYAAHVEAGAPKIRARIVPSDRISEPEISKGAKMQVYENSRYTVDRLVETLERGSFFEPNTTWEMSDVIFERIMGGRRLLSEGLTKSLAKDFLQALVSGGAEYGLVLTGVGAAGPAEVTETVIDAVFAADNIASAAAAVKSFAAGAGRFSELLNNILSMAQQGIKDFNKFYRDVRDAVQIGIRLIGKKAQDKVDELAEKLKKFVADFIGTAVDALADGIKVLIPDAAISLSVSTTIKTAIAKLSENSYNNFTKIVGLSKGFKDFLFERGVANEFFDNAIKGLLELLANSRAKIEKMGWREIMLASLTPLTGPLTGPGIKVLGPKLIEYWTNTLKNYGPKVSKLIDSLVSYIVPAVTASLAVVQVILKGEYKGSLLSSLQSDTKDDVGSNLKSNLVGVDAEEGDAGLNELREMIGDVIREARRKKGGLWANIWARRRAGKRPRRPGEKGYPKTLKIG